MTTTDVLDHTAVAYHRIPVDDLVPAPDNPRWDLAVTDELVASVKAVGVIQPLLVRPHPDQDGRFEIVCGHRRHGAADAAGLVDVPAVVRGDLDEPTRMALMFEENHHRGDLSPIEEAYALKRMVDLPGMNQTKAAERMGLAQPTASKRIKLTKLPQAAQDALHKRFHDPKHPAGITVEQAEKLADIDADRVAALWEKQGAFKPWAVDELVRDHDRAKETARRRAELEAAGKTVLADDVVFNRVEGPAPLWQLALDPDNHQAEPCHAYALTGRGVDEVCTAPSRHRDDKADAADKRRTTKADKEREAEKAEAQAAADARTGFLRELLASGEVLGAGAHIAFSLLNAAVSEVSYNAVEGAWSLLGRDGSDVDDLYDRIPLIAAEASAGLLEQMALAVALADVEMSIGGQWGRWDEPRVARHFDFLRAHGYQPSDYELEKLAVALAEHTKAEVEASVAHDDDLEDWPAAVQVEDAGTTSPAFADVDDQEIDPEPAVVHEITVRKSGKKFRVRCSCGDLNVLNTTDAFAQQAGEAHLKKAGVVTEEVSA